MIAEVVEMAQIDYRKIPVRELYLYMNLVMGFCSDMRRLLSEMNLTAEAIDKYEMTTVNNLIAEVNYRSLARNRRRPRSWTWRKPKP